MLDGISYRDGLGDSMSWEEAFQMHVAVEKSNLGLWTLGMNAVVEKS